MIVIDANVFAKLLIDEHDSAIAEEFFKYCLTHEVPLIAPTLFHLADPDAGHVSEEVFAEYLRCWVF